MNEERGSLYLLTGLIIGLVLGVLWGWYVAPVTYTDTEPDMLNPAARDEYRLLIALSYLYTNDIARSQARLVLLKDEDPASVLAAQAQRANANGRPSAEVQALGQLALVAAGPPAGIPTAVPLTVFPTVTALPSLTPVPVDQQATDTAETAANEPTATNPPPASPTARPTSTVTPTPSPFPTATQTATPGNPFILDSRLLTCPSNAALPKLVVQTFDRSGNGVPGVEVILNWPDNEEHIFTGLKPELGLGYADFTMSQGIRYTLRLADGSQLIPDITPEQCDAGGGRLVWGTLELTFVQP